MLVQIKSMSWETKPIQEDTPLAVQCSVWVWWVWLKEHGVILKTSVGGHSRISTYIDHNYLLAYYN